MKKTPPPKKKKSKKKKEEFEVFTPPPHLLQKTEQPRTIAEQIVDAGLILEACNGDDHTAQFFLIWLQNGRNATEAYLSMHQGISRYSAQVLGSRELAKVDRAAVMESYGLGYDSYMKQLAAGLTATKLVGLQGEEVEDHKTRRDYHKAQGEILGIEQKAQAAGPVFPGDIGKMVNNWIVTKK